MRTVVKTRVVGGLFPSLGWNGSVIVINRFRSTDPDDSVQRARLEEALAVLSVQRGYVDGHVARNVDDPDLWLLQTQWQGPGAYRRALSAYDVKMRAWSLLGEAVDEPSAYEILRPGEESNRAEPRHNP